MEDVLQKKNDDSIIEFELFDVGQRRLRNMGILWWCDNMKQNHLLQNDVNRVQLYSGYFLNEKCDRIVVILEFIFAVAQVILQCDMQQFGAKVCELHKKFIIEFWELSSWCISEKYQKKYVLKRILTIFTSFWFMTLFMSAGTAPIGHLVM